MTWYCKTGCLGEALQRRAPVTSMPGEWEVRPLSLIPSALSAHQECGSGSQHLSDSEQGLTRQSQHLPFPSLWQTSLINPVLLAAELSIGLRSFLNTRQQRSLPTNES